MGMAAVIYKKGAPDNFVWEEIKVGAPERGQVMKDAGDHSLVIDAPGAGLVPRRMRLDRRPRLIRQPEQRHAPSPVIHTIRESGKLLRLKPLIGFEP